MTVETDRHYMRLALREARKGLGRTSPNPCVGAVIVKDGRIVGKGYHKKAGEAHAEINALYNAKDLAIGATIYITLEPCSHTGRTPPCCHAVARSGVKRVVVGMEDPNPLVAGRGLAYLQERGIEVTSGVLAEECREINRPFLKYITSSIPWVVMKAGISLDGRITYQRGKGGLISGPETLRRVHRLRDITDAIMVGVDTVLIDNPSLTTRLPGKKGKDPVRVILDTALRIPPSAQVLNLDSPAPTWVFCGRGADFEQERRLAATGVRVLRVAESGDGHLDLQAVLQTLGAEQITSVLVEGGATVHGSMLRGRLVDHVMLFYAPIFAGDQGISVVEHIATQNREGAIYLEKIRHTRIGDDVLIEGDVRYPGSLPG